MEEQLYDSGEDQPPQAALEKVSRVELHIPGINKVSNVQIENSQSLDVLINPGIDNSVEDVESSEHVGSNSKEYLSHYSTSQLDKMIPSTILGTNFFDKS